MKDLETLYKMADNHPPSQELLARNDEHFISPNYLDSLYAQGIADPDDHVEIITQSLVVWLLSLYDDAKISLPMFIDGFRVVDSLHAQHAMALYAYLFPRDGGYDEAA